MSLQQLVAVELLVEGVERIHQRTPPESSATFPAPIAAAPVRVSSQHYQDADWTQLVEFWHAY
jgi:hypothetical protein